MIRTHFLGHRATRTILAFAAMAVAVSCADKGLLVKNGVAFNPNIALQVTLPSAQQVSGTSARFILLASGFEDPDTSSNCGGNSGAAPAGGCNNGDNFNVVSAKWAPLLQGTQTLTLNSDVSRCVAAFVDAGKSACELMVAVFITKDTVSLAGLDTLQYDPERESFDYSMQGPFLVGPGRAPTIPPIDLSVSRFGVVQWVGDDPMRVGGKFTPSGFSTAVTGITGPGGTVTLFAGTTGSVFPSSPLNQPGGGIQGPYPQLAILEAGQWRRVSATIIPPTSQNSTSSFSGVAAISATEVYMSHPQGLFKYDGTSISRVTTVTDSAASVAAITTSGGQKLVIVGTNNGATWIGDGTTFTRRTLGTTNRMDGVCITGPSEAFAISTNGGAFRFDGTNWAAASNPFPTTPKLALQCPAAGQAFMLAQAQLPLTWNGSQFVTMSVNGLNNQRLIVWGVVSPTEIYAAGDSVSIDRAFYRFNGSTWTEVARSRFASGVSLSQLRLWADPRGGAAYYGSAFARIEKVTPTGVSVVSYQPAPRDLIVNSATSAFAVGWNMFLARWDGVKWTMDAGPPRTQSVRVLHGVWSDGPNNAWAVGNASTIYRYTGAAGGWTTISENVAPVAQFDTSYNAVWGVGTDVFVVGNQTILHCRVTSCSNEASPGTGALLSVWGTSLNNMFAVGNGGRIIRYNGTSWSAMTSPTSRNLARVRGSGPNDIWAVGDSVVIHFDGTNWSTVPLIDDLARSTNRVPSGFQNLFQVGLFVRGPKEVYIGGDGGLVRWDGSQWRQMTDGYNEHKVISISMAPSGCGFALTELATDAAGPSLWRGVGPTGCMGSPISPVTSWP